mmetsp:Transcript_8614/g.24772  ORF Transcript_8614/g.24772 Transcript_8614/m.24772 type:complete len:206 (+) Transcript_8614:4500-5117(+)
MQHRTLQEVRIFRHAQCCQQRQAFGCRAAHLVTRRGEQHDEEILCLVHPQRPESDGHVVGRLVQRNCLQACQQHSHDVNDGGALLELLGSLVLITRNDHASSGLRQNRGNQTFQHFDGRLLFLSAFQAECRRECLNRSVDQPDLRAGTWSARQLPSSDAMQRRWRFSLVAIVGVQAKDRAFSKFDVFCIIIIIIISVVGLDGVGN